MANLKYVLNVCTREQITIEQFFFLYMLKNGEYHKKESPINKYVKVLGQFDYNTVIEPLLSREYLLDLNSDGKCYPEFFVPTDTAEEIFANDEMAMEIWNKYPALLPLSGGGNFWARVGIEKENFIDEYLKRIDYSKEQHEIVKRRLDIYINMVKRGEVNGHTIFNFLKQMLWEAIDDENNANDHGFGIDI